jgi:GTP pyrophosphokinase
MPLNLATCRHIFEETLALLQPRSTPGELELLEEAYLTAAEGHGRQRRYSGDPYLIHVVEVGHILAQMGADAETVAAGLLHDLLEDTGVAPRRIKEHFGPDVYHMVQGVTEVEKAERADDERGGPSADAEATLKRLLLAASHDPRVLLIKLADRLHNMRTAQHLPEDKRRRKALETLEIYAPLAHRLGVAKLRWEMEDLAMMYLHPEVYDDIARELHKRNQAREELVNAVSDKLRAKLDELGIEATIFGRSKHIYSIYKKLQRKQRSLEELHDLVGVRVITRETADCYSVLGVVHSLWRPVSGSFRDYIANPKPNLYQSLHTAVLDDEGRRVEVQIRTERMNFFAEYGLAAHFSYKGDAELTLLMDNELAWLRKIVDWEKKAANDRTFASAVKVDLFSEQIFAITPKGDPVDLPRGSTVLDFAFRIHTDLGRHCSGARVNGQLQPLTYRLAAGDRVEILTRPEAHPRPTWLRFVKTANARQAIRRWLREHPQHSTRPNRTLVRLYTKGNLELYRRLLDRVLHQPEMELTKCSYTRFGHTNIILKARVPDTDERPAEQARCLERLTAEFPGLTFDVKR